MKELVPLQIREFGFCPILPCWRAFCLIVAGVLPFGTPLALAQPHEFSVDQCLIKIQGVVYEANPCFLNEETDDVIRFGYLDTDKNAGHWAYIIKGEDGTFEAFWNEEYGAPRAHTRLGDVIHEVNSKGECWINENVRLCRNSPKGELY